MGALLESTGVLRDQTYRLLDGSGVYLEISPKDGKWWRLKCRFNDKEKRLSLGVYSALKWDVYCFFVALLAWMNLMINLKGETYEKNHLK